MSVSNKTILWFFDHLICRDELDKLMSKLLSDFNDNLHNGDPLNKLENPWESHHYYQFQKYHYHDHKVIYSFTPDSVSSEPEYHARSLKKDLKNKIDKEYREVLNSIDGYLEHRDHKEISNFLTLQLDKIKEIKESLQESEVYKFYPEIGDTLNNIQGKIEERIELYLNKSYKLISKFSEQFSSRNDVSYNAEDIKQFLLVYEKNKNLSVSEIIRLAEKKREKLKTPARGTFDGWIKNWKEFHSNAQQNT